VIGSSGIAGNGNLSVAIGSTGGWGFKITNDSSNFLTSNLSDFCPGGVFISPCSNAFGPYTDFYGPNFVVVNPLSTLTEFFSAGLVTGVGSIALTNPGINPGDSISGQVFFVYDVFSDAGLSSQVGGDVLVGANATVTAVSSVPEASPFSFFALGFAALGVLRRCRG
jgi:hypothetical protein